MKLYLKNHTERYPVEQLQLQLFAQEPSEFCTEPFTGDGTVSSLSRGKQFLTAAAKVTYRGRTGFASNRVRLEDADVRATRRILQRSYYLAAMQVLDAAPPWGALSGVRPTKLSTRCLSGGGSEKDAERLLRETYFVSPARAKLCVDASRHTIEAAKLLDPDDLSVYIGIPFCPTRCAYCSFVSQSIERFGEFLPAYLDALLREIAHTGKLLRDSGFHIRTLYIGGGTPTTLSSAQMAQLLEAIHTSFDLSRCLEFTVEGGRPDTLDEEKLRVIKAGGATRISINPQTMSDKVLAAVGRRHTARQTIEAFYQAVRAGFDDSNITVHTLALKKGAALFSSRAPLPPQEAVAAMLAGAEDALRGNGYEPYYLYRQKYMSGSFENTGWCRPGHTGLYNIYMMEELHTILSLGGGGMNKINLPAEKLARYHNPKIPQDYISRIDTILQQKDEIFSLLRQIREQNP